MTSALGRITLAGARRFQRHRSIQSLGMTSAGKRGFKTNPYAEEWSGKREISEKTFTYTPMISFGLVMTIVVFPMALYGSIKSGMEEKDAELGRKQEYL